LAHTLTVLFDCRTGERLRTVPSATYRRMEYDLVGEYGGASVEIHTVDEDEEHLTLEDCRRLNRF